MEYVHAALILHEAGKPITSDAIVSVLKAAGVEADAARAKALEAALKGVNIADALKASVAAPVAAAPAAPAAGAAPAKKEEKKEEKPAEEQAAAGLASLFG